MPLLYEPQLIASFLVLNDMSGIWIAWSSVFAMATSLIFFSGLWERLPIKTENDFSLFRYSGWSAELLTSFRAVFLGVIIIPLILAQSILGFSHILSTSLSISTTNAYLLMGIFLSISAFFNDIRKRILTDAWMAVVFILLLLWFSVGIILQLGTPAEMSQTIHSAGFRTSLFPAASDVLGWNNVLLFLGFQWWSAVLCDMPDMDGQKLLNAKGQKGTVHLLTGLLLFMVIQVFLMLIPLYALGSQIDQPFASGEELIAQFFFNLHGTVKFAGIGMLLVAFVSLTSNFQLWSAGMIESRLHQIASLKHKPRNRLMPVLWMILITWLSIFLATQHNSLVSIVEHLFVVSAGVGPVFILRWFWKRINAWSQFSAMVASLLYAFGFSLLHRYVQAFQVFELQFQKTLSLTAYASKLMILTIAVTLTWVLITFLSPPVRQSQQELFFQTVRTRLFPINFSMWGYWLLACVGFFTIKTGWWNMLTGNSAIGTVELFIATAALFLVARYFVKKQNDIT